MLRQVSLELLSESGVFWPRVGCDREAVKEAQSWGIIAESQTIETPSEGDDSYVLRIFPSLVLNTAFQIRRGR